MNLMKSSIPNIEWFSIEIELKASCVLMLPAGDEQEAVYEAYRRMVPVNGLYEVERDAVRVTQDESELNKRYSDDYTRLDSTLTIGYSFDYCDGHCMVHG